MFACMGLAGCMKILPVYAANTTAAYGQGRFWTTAHEPGVSQENGDQEKTTYEVLTVMEVPPPE